MISPLFPATFPRARMDSQCMRARAVNLDRNLKPKLATMRQCTSVTDRRTDRRTLASGFGSNWGIQTPTLTAPLHSDLVSLLIVVEARRTALTTKM